MKIPAKMILLVVAFLIKLRFPNGKPLSSIILQRYGRDTLTCYRTIEKTSEQMIKALHHIKFLNTCKLYDLTPKFLRFKLYNQNLHSSDHYRTYQRILLDKEIKFQNKKVSRSRTKLPGLKAHLKSQVSWLDHHCLIHR